MSNGRVLIVEDDVDLSHMLEYNLSKRGYHALTALDGLAACTLIEEEEPDLILLDIMLPGLNGWEVCEIVRRHERKSISEIPIIMLTALGSSGEKIKGVEMGADDYIPKPFSLKEVLLKVDRLVRREMKKRDLSAEVEQLEATTARQGDLQNMLFHELRNHLFIIGGYSTRIAEKQSMTPEEQQKCHEGIMESCRALNSLTEEILVLSKLEAGEYAFPRTDLSMEETVRQIVVGLSGQAHRKGMRIVLEKKGAIPVMYLNRTAVFLSISNLVENAVKYGRDRSDVIVRLEARPGEGVALEVEDSGPGIPEEEREQVFHKFYRGKNTRNNTKGTGLGLHITKMLIELMGGTVTLESADGRGSRFKVFYPFRQTGDSSLAAYGA